MDMLTLQNMHPNLPPSITNPRQAETVSNKYGFFNTSTMLELFIAAGFEIVKDGYSATRTRKKDPRSAKHLMRLRPHNAKPIHGVYPEVVVLNSHNGTSLLIICVGMCRIACLNKMILMDAVLFPEQRIRHTQMNINTIQAAMQTIMESALSAADRIPKMAEITMTRSMMEAYADEAAGLLPQPLNADGVSTSRLRESSQLLTIKREADRGQNLWSTFNVVQENLMRGGMNTSHVGRRRGVTRAVNNIQKNVALNTGLWNLTLKYEKKHDALIHGV